MPIYCRFYINFAAHFNRGREKNVTIFYHFSAAPLHVITDKITKIFLLRFFHSRDFHFLSRELHDFQMVFNQRIFISLFIGPHDFYGLFSAITVRQ